MNVLDCLSYGVYCLFIVSFSKNKYETYLVFCLLVCLFGVGGVHGGWMGRWMICFALVCLVLLEEGLK